MPLLSIVIPAYNEEAFIGALLRKVLAAPVESLGFRKEIIIVDDGSRDRTEEIARQFPSIRFFKQSANFGKGMAVRRGISEAAGDYILIQDADLEYDPGDYPALLNALKRGDVVYGSRTMGRRREQGRWTLFPGKHPAQRTGPWLAGVLLKSWVLMLYGRRITDMLTAYRLYPSAAVKGMKLRTRGFETEHEITARLIRSGHTIVEVPIGYCPRSVREGKKIRFSDGLIAVWTLLRFRFVR